MTRPSCIVADHRSLLAAGLAEALDDHGLDVVATVGDVAAARLQVERHAPDVVLVHAAMVDGLHGLLPELRAMAGRPRLLVLAAADDSSDAGLLSAIETGADGFVSTEDGIAGIADAVRRLASGDAVIPPEMLGSLLRNLIDARREASDLFERLMQLTPREREILPLLAEGLDRDQIAAELVISPDTARTHVQRVLRKLEVSSHVEAIALVRRHGLADRLERVNERSNA